jgi:hypothetical protein
MNKEKKTVLFTIKIKPSEKEWLEAKSKETGLTMTQVLMMYNWHTKQLK